MKLVKHPDHLSAVLASFWEEIFPKVDAHAIPEILERIQAWVGEQPFMTQVLCSYVVAQVSEVEASDAAAIVDKIVQQDIIGNWQNSTAAPHLSEIRQILLDYEQKDLLLLLYIKIIQRDEVPTDNSPEQEVLLRSGLVHIERGSLKIACPLYAKIFDLTWVEQQLPGITRPVTVIGPASIGSLNAKNKASAQTQLLSKVAVAAVCLAVVIAAVSAYFRDSGSQAIADSSLARRDEAVNVVSVEDAKLEAARDLFDNGVEHAKNARWLPMLRELCSLPAASTYYGPAEGQMTQWVKLYGDDIQIARDTFVDEGHTSCKVVDDALAANTE
ncbi:MAG: hypothetical protein WA885_19590 [Phormidesmis sp.]